MTSPSCVVAAPAKLNTHLEILGRRDDGFHELDTRMVAIAPCDLVHVRVREGSQLRAHDAAGEDLRLSVEGPAASADVTDAGADNLVVRAARDALAAIRDRVPEAASVGLDLRLVKHVPSRAGLGGASADASAALLACDEVFAARFGQRLGQARLVEFAARHGSDTVFFLAARFGGQARATGRGERVSTAAVERGARWFVVVVPDLGCSTPAVYGAYAEGARGSRPHAPRRNDLERAALEVEPELAAWFDALGPAFGLSGSGSCLFAQAPDRRAAQALARCAQEAIAALGRTPRLFAVAPALGHGVRPLTTASMSIGGGSAT